MIATGETVQRAYLAAQILEQNNVHATVMSMHTIKPFDQERELGVWTENPFEADVRNVTVMEFLCKECHHDLMMEV